MIMPPCGKIHSSDESYTVEVLRICECEKSLWLAAPELLQAANGCLGYLRALPKEYRPDERWFIPLENAIKKAKKEVN